MEHAKINSTEITEEIIHAISVSRIYFGHQSVGDNIIDGINNLFFDKKWGLNIINFNIGQKITGPALYHGYIGQNKLPESKIEAFENVLDSLTGSTLDIAFFKFCYIDFLKNTDVIKVFDTYKTAFQNLSIKYPNTRFIHITSPLKAKEKGIRGILNKVRGRNQNARRCKFNKLMVSEFNEKDVFDLAYYESTHLNGKREFDGWNAYALVREYTHDGGHLNELGKRVIAAHFLNFLAQ
jgi:hypothetical protein